MTEREAVSDKAQDLIPPVSGPWNPGIDSRIPEDLLPLATIFRLENVFAGVEFATEMQDLTGIDRSQLTLFRPQRLVLHELLIRVMADLSVNDGARIEDLGINFRKMTDTILTRYIEPHMDSLVRAYDAIREQLHSVIDAALSAALAPPAAPVAVPTTPGRGLFRLFRRNQTVPANQSGSEHAATDEYQFATRWETQASASADALHKAAYRALARIGSALLARHGQLWGGRELIARVATGLACNDYASDELGRLIEPYIAQACAGEGFAMLSAQAHPHVMNTKGASASGKSTMRPLQKALADRIGVRWSDFALISPDVWRKRLLDYDSLGPHYKYAGSFTGDEIHIIDQKLDRYMAHKAERGGMTHLLIDRFRFDSFAPDSDEAGSNLLTRFGHVLYLFFMVTPPESTVARSWKRGLEVGRYKAVDDLLAHNVAAYTGMPQLFFTWACRDDKRVHYEFLDNSVPPHQGPLTIAFGWNHEMNVLDVARMVDIVRYRKLDINATGPEKLFPEREAIAPEHCTDFLRQCVRELAAVNFADQATGRIYLRVEAGTLVWIDPDGLAAAADDPDTRAALLAVAPCAFDGAVPVLKKAIYLRDIARAKPIPTLGRWGQEFDCKIFES